MEEVLANCFCVDFECGVVVAKEYAALLATLNASSREVSEETARVCVSCVC